MVKLKIQLLHLRVLTPVFLVIYHCMHKLSLLDYGELDLFLLKKSISVLDLHVNGSFEMLGLSFKLVRLEIGRPDFD